MTTVRATCWDCGDIRTTADRVTLRYLTNSDFEKASYRFICPQCNRIVVKPITDKSIAVLLKSSDVNVEEYDMPLELLERPKEDEAPAISEDDLIDICLAIEQDEAGWLSRMKDRRNET